MAIYGPKLNRDWIGLRVTLRREAQNLVGVVARGARGEITEYTGGRRGIQFTPDGCSHCGCSIIISGLRREDFTILTPPEAWRNTQTQGWRP